MTDPVDWEDLDNNTFFQVVKTNKVYKEASSNRYHVLIPQMLSLSGVSLNQSMLAMHILKPSPYFVGGFQTLDGRGEVELNEIEKTITTKTGFPEQRTVKILFEELFYNDDMQSFRVMCIDNMLAGGNAAAVLEAASSSTLFTPKRTAKEYVNFLVGFKENVPALRRLNVGMRDFKKSYVLVRGFESDAVERIDSMCTGAVQEMVKANPHFGSCRFNKKHMAELHLAVRSYFISGVYDKLMPSIQNMHEDEDQYLEECLQQATHITATDLGIRVEFQCPQPEAVHCLSQLNQYTTPREKLICLKDTTQCITRAVDSYLSHFKLKETLAFSTDDLLPLLIYVLIQSKPEYLKSNIVFMQSFQAPHVGSNELGFTLVTFEAAVEYLKSDAVAGKLRARKRSQTTNDARSVAPGSLAHIALEQQRANAAASSDSSGGQRSRGNSVGDSTGTGAQASLSAAKNVSSTENISVSKTLSSSSNRGGPMSASEELLGGSSAVQKNLANLRRQKRSDSAPPPLERAAGNNGASNTTTVTASSHLSQTNPYRDASTGRFAAEHARGTSTGSTSRPGAKLPPYSSNPFDEQPGDGGSLELAKAYVPAPSRIALEDKPQDDFLAALRNMGDGSSSGRF